VAKIASGNFSHMSQAELYMSSSDFFVETSVVAIFEFFLKIPIAFPPLGNYPG